MSFDRKNNREDFIKEVQKFKSRFGGVRNALNNASQELLSNSLIHSYLTREANRIEFKDNHPDLKNEKSDKENSDYYEVKLYKSLPFFASYYRNNVDNEKYYMLGSFCKALINHQSRMFNVQYEKSGIFMFPVADIYDIRHTLNAILYDQYSQELRKKISKKSIKKESLKFILFPNWKDGHATVIVAIFDSDNNKVLAAIFINSEQNLDYTKYISCRFNYKGYYNYFIDSDSKKSIFEFIKNNFDLDIQAPDLCLKDGKMAYLFNQKCNHLKKLDELDKDGFDLKFSVNNGIDSFNYLYVNTKIPLIDASHHLQTQDEDCNCVLYGLNFINAMLAMLDNKEFSEPIFQLAQKLSLGNKEAEAELKNIFGHELKGFLPCYYREDKSVKSYKEIKDHHLKQRWDIGNKALSTYFPENVESLAPNIIQFGCSFP